MNETRLVNTGIKILGLYWNEILKLASQKNLTSGPESPTSIVESVTFGSNQIIGRIGRDRSHISKAIDYLKKIGLLIEHTKWEKGKIKDTRITSLGLSIAILFSGIEIYENLYSKLHHKIEKHYKLPKGIDELQKEEMLKKMGWDRNIITTYEIAVSYARKTEFNLLSFFISTLISKYSVMILEPNVKPAVKRLVEDKILDFIRRSLHNLTITTLDLEGDAKEYAISELLSSIIAPSFMASDSIIHYFKFDYDDLPNDGNKKFIKENIRDLLGCLFHILKPNDRMIPLWINLEQYKEFLPNVSVDNVKQAWQNVGVGSSQIFSIQNLDNTDGSESTLTTKDGTEYNITTDFEEISIRIKEFPEMKPRNIMRCAHFNNKLIITLHKDLRIPVSSHEFQLHYEFAKKSIYEALNEIDYVNEFNLDMPLFEIRNGENDLIKSIRIENLAKDIHDEILRVILTTVLRTLLGSSDIYENFLGSKHEVGRNTSEFIFRRSPLLE